MFNMKKLAAAGITVVMAAAMAGCGGSSSGSSSGASSAPAETEGKTYNVGVCQLVQHVALDAATQGFQDALKEAFGDSVTFDVQNAQGDSNTCSTIVNSFVSADVDLIMANATAALQASAAGTSEIPVLGTSVTDYATALELSDFDGTVGGNISGTSDLAPLDGQAELFTELLPDVKTIGLLYCSAEPNSKFQVDTIRGYLESAGYTCVDKSFSDSNDIATVVTGATADCDALYIPTDNTAASNTEIINNICEPAGIPIIAGEEGICKGCGIATLSIDYYELGQKTGEMAAEILNGGDISAMAIEYAPNFTKEYIAERAEKLGITVPDDYVAIEAE